MLEKHTAFSEEFFTKDEFCKTLKVTTRTADRWNIRRVGPPRIKIGQKVFYRRASVMKWLERLENQGVRA